MGQVFISHVEEDERVAIQVAGELETAGFTTWYYERDSLPGVSYLLQTRQAIEDSQALILLISSNSLESHQITREVVHAHESGKAFFPILLDVTHVEFQSRQPEWAEAIGAAASIRLSEEGIENLVSRLVKGLEASGILPVRDQVPGIEKVEKPSGLNAAGKFEGDSRSRTIQAATGKTHKNFFRSCALSPIMVLAIIILGSIAVWLGVEKIRPKEIGNPPSTSILTMDLNVAEDQNVSPTSTLPPVPTAETSGQNSLADPGTVEPEELVDSDTAEADMGYMLPFPDLYDLVFDGKMHALYDDRLVELERIDPELRFRAASINSGFNANSIAWDTSRRQYWTIRGSPHIVYRDVDVLDPSGAPVHTYRVPETVSYLRYITWDGNYLWTTTSDGTLLKWSPSSTNNDLQMVDSYAPKVGKYANREATGLEWDGVNLWILADDLVTRLDENTRIECQIVLSSNAAPSLGIEAPSWYGYRGLAWDGNYLWVGHSEENVVYRIDPASCK